MAHIEIFSKGLTYDFRQKLRIPFMFVFAQNELNLQLMFDDHLVRKQALLNYKNIEFTELPN